MTLRSLLVRGPFHGPTGYDHHVREFVRELHRQGITIQLVDVPEWGPARLMPDQQDPWFDTLQQDVGARVALHFTMPHQVTPYPGFTNVNYTMFEATRVHPSWIGHAGLIDRVIVPTESSRAAWLESGLDSGKIRVSPLGVDAGRFGPPTPPHPLGTERGRPVMQYQTRLLNIAEMSPRKNQAGLLRSWLRATTRDDDAVLILKLGLYSPGWAAEWGPLIRRVQAETGRLFDEAAPIHVFHAILTDAELPGLYAAATHYVSLSFGEGWDQPMVEAAASGLRLIAPNHSAYRAYLDRTTAALLPSTEAPADHPGGGPTGLLFKHARWWVPDEAAAVAAIRSAVRGTDAPERSARESILRDFTWKRSTKRLISHLEEMQPERRRLPWRGFSAIPRRRPPDMN
jgi:glycosyltransferase involved in cell wall biosynthesis